MMNPYLNPLSEIGFHRPGLNAIWGGNDERRAVRIGRLVCPIEFKQPYERQIANPSTAWIL